MSSTGADGLVRRGESKESGLSDSKIESARRFLYDEDDSFSTVGDTYPVASSTESNVGSRRTIGYGRTGPNNNSNSHNNPGRSFNTVLYHTRNLSPRSRKILMVAIAVLVVIISASLLGKGSGSKEGIHSQKHRHGSRLQQFQSAIVELGLTSQEDLDNPEKPQYQALHWLANSDGAKLKSDDPFAIQRFALAVLYFETSGMEDIAADPTTETGVWLESSNWLTKSGICSWHGIVCEGDSPLIDEETDKENRNHHGLVQTMDLKLNGLKGSIPSEISALTRLNTLDLSNNDLNGSLPRSLSKLTELRSLLLRGNEIDGQIPKDFLQELSNLRDLVLAENQLKGRLPSDVEHLVELRVLDIGSNELTGTVPGLETLRKLRLLIFEDNQFEGKFPESLTKLTLLVDLNLGKNHFTGVLPGDLAQLTRLGTFP